MPNRRPFLFIAVTALLSVALGACGDDLPDPGGDLGAGGDASGLVGVWRANYQDPMYGSAEVDTVLQADGSFSQTTEYLDLGSQWYMTGTYGLVDASTIRFTIENYEPKEICGPGGCTPIRIGEGETVSFSFVDANTLRTDSLNCDGAGCEVTHTRVS